MNLIYAFRLLTLGTTSLSYVSSFVTPAAPAQRYQPLAFSTSSTSSIRTITARHLSSDASEEETQSAALEWAKQQKMKLMEDENIVPKEEKEALSKEVEVEVVNTDVDVNMDVDDAKDIQESKSSDDTESQEEALTEHKTSKKKYVVIGGGWGGWGAAKTLCQSELDAEVILIDALPDPTGVSFHFLYFF